jgi:hypothetical protein
VSYAPSQFAGEAGGLRPCSKCFYLVETLPYSNGPGALQQSFNVSQTSDNSNQCAGIQGVGNTSNAQNLTDVIQYGSEADDFEFEEVGSTIEMNPTNTTTCDQQVNQAASASGGGGSGKPTK